MSTSVTSRPLTREDLRAIPTKSNREGQARCQGSCRRRYPRHISSRHHHVRRGFRRFPRRVLCNPFRIMRHTIRVRPTNFCDIGHARLIRPIIGDLLISRVNYLKVPFRHLGLRLILLYPMLIRIGNLQLRCNVNPFRSKQRSTIRHARGRYQGRRSAGPRDRQARGQGSVRELNAYRDLPCAVHRVRGHSRANGTSYRANRL